jgi:hypothetical protein
MLARHHTSGSAPQFEEREIAIMPLDLWKKLIDTTAIGISRPSWLGVWMGFLLGHRPIFSTDIGSPIEHPSPAEPMQAFSGELNKITNLKRIVQPSSK